MSNQDVLGSSDKFAFPLTKSIPGNFSWGIEHRFWNFWKRGERTSRFCHKWMGKTSVRHLLNTVMLRYDQGYESISSYGTCPVTRGNDSTDLQALPRRCDTRTLFKESFIYSFHLMILSCKNAASVYVSPSLRSLMIHSYGTQLLAIKRIFRRGLSILPYLLQDNWRQRLSRGHNYSVPTPGEGSLTVTSLPQCTSSYSAALAQSPVQTWRGWPVGWIHILSITLAR